MVIGGGKRGRHVAKGKDPVGSGGDGKGRISSRGSGFYYQGFLSKLRSSLLIMAGKEMWMF